jgi:glycosyltransferase involved in cell wall biosynthesis
MRVLFCHDHRFVLAANGAVFSNGQYSQRLIARYESVFENVFIAARTDDGAAPVDVSRFNKVFDGSSRFVPVPSLSGFKPLLFGDPLAKRQLEAAIDEADAVIVRLPSEIGLMAGQVAKEKRKPLITEVVGCVWDALRSYGGAKAVLYAPLAYARTRRAVARSEWTLYVTERFLQARYPAKGEQAGISDVDLPSRDETALPRRLARAAGGALRFGMIAAMANKRKRVDVAIRALSVAIAQGADLHLEVVGPGDTALLRRLADDLGVGARVRFQGVVAHGEQLFNWLDTLDAYVQTSFQEGMPRALIEAMSRALPALGSDVGGTYELLPQDWLHKPGDVSMLAGQMLVLRDQELRRSLARQNFERANDFAREVLESRRQAFWNRFREAHGLGAGRQAVQ